jgi:hypothetical protein
VVGGGGGVDEPGPDRAILEAAGFSGGLDAFDPTAAALGLGAALDLAHRRCWSYPDVGITPSGLVRIRLVPFGVMLLVG